MAKNTTLSSDVDFIKEFEELKLKQKLLIDSLNKKNISQQSQLFMEINSKLDFLVKIFKDANDTDSKIEEEKLEIHFKGNSEKLDLIQKNILEKLDKQQTEVSALKVEIQNLTAKVNTPITPTVITSIPVLPTPNFEIENKLELSIPSSQTQVVPIPIPVKSEGKKGWFK